MTEKYISSIHIEKLSHNILEIRERALLNILSKLERGFQYDNELSRSKEILIKLLDWFKFRSFKQEDLVLNLIRRILQTECGKMLINLFGSSVLNDEISQLKSKLSEEFHPIIEEILILFKVEEEETTRDVPPFEVDIPLSYRTDEESLQIGTTATPIEGVIIGGGSVENQASCGKSFFDNGSSSARHLPYYFLPWQSLIAADRHVLESIEETLCNPTDPTTLLHSFDFFTNVLLHDFPAEVFLQRPSIIKLFHDLLWSCPSSRIATAILNCLEKLTKVLKTRIQFYSDPCTYNTKTQNILCGDSARSEANSQTMSHEVSDTEKFEETVFLMKKQMSLPQYCLNTMHSIFDYLYIPPESGDRFKRKKCKIGINTSLLLLNGVVELLILSVKKEIWTNKDNEIIIRNINRINDVFSKYADILEHFRLDMMSSDWNEESRIIHLHLLYNFVYLFENLVPIEKSDEILPRSLKNALSNSILDPALSRIYPSIHERLLFIIKELNGSYETDSFNRYNLVKKICDSMSAAMKFLRNWKSLTVLQNINLAKQAFISLEFHKDLKFLNTFIDICANKISMHSFEEEILKEIDYIVLAALSHKLEEIRLDAYRLCQKKVVSTIGAKLNVSKTSSPGNQISFLLRQKVLLEISVHGTIDFNTEIQNYAEDILVHILKCKILVSEEIWSSVIDAILPNLPILLCHVSRSTLGRTIFSILDPDRSHSLNIPVCEVIKGNVGLLFSEVSQTRDEAVSRLCWILSSKTEGRNLLPHINNLHDRSLGLVCRSDKTVDYTKYKFNQHFYQPSGLHQVMDLLNSRNVEPVVRRSAVTQISVMMEDPILHPTFFEKNGISLIKEIMESALTENDYNDYPDSVIGCITVLKNVSLYNSAVRQELSYDVEIFHFVLRGLFMYFTEERVKTDGSILLYLLVFANFVKGSPLKNDLSMPCLFLNKLKGPFLCNGHWKFSENSLMSLIDLASDKWTLTTLQIHWNTEWFGGLEEILNLDLVRYDETANFNDILKLKQNDLFSIKSTSLEYCIEKHLKAINRAESHKEVIENINNLVSCINLYNLISSDDLEYSKDITDLPWEKSFEKYMNTPPSSPEDNIILKHILQFLLLLFPVFKTTRKNFWVIGILKNRKHILCDLLILDALKDPNVKQLLHALLDLITASVCKEQTYLDFHLVCQKDNEGYSKSWCHLTEIMVAHLKFGDAEHFYNLAYLDHLLSTLVHLTSHLGWSGNKPNDSANKLISQLSIGLCELVGAFHYGKGPSASDSLMGLSITRHVVFIFNHILAEMQHLNVKNWEEIFFGNDINDESTLICLFSLWTSRDVVLRAATFHLFSGLAVSFRTSAKLVQVIICDKLNIWEIVLNKILEHDEASVVKENATILLTNLVSHVKLDSEIEIMFNVLPRGKFDNESSSLKIVFGLLAEQNFFKELKVILVNLYTQKTYFSQDLRFENESTNESSASSSSEDFSFVQMRNAMSTDRTITNITQNKPKIEMISTPGFVKSLGLFLFNLIILSPQDICNYLQDHGLTKSFLKCINVPNFELETTKDLALYCEILELNTSICNLLAQAVSKNTGCLLTVCNTRDCLTVILSLLNPHLYFTSLPQLLYLRNKLWSAIYNLIGIVLEHNQNETGLQTTDALSIISSVISERRQESFLQTLCESISTKMSNDLQISALSSLTSLLKVESHREVQKNIYTNGSLSMQNLLDFTKTPRSSRSVESIDKPSNHSKFKILQNIYFTVDLCSESEEEKSEDDSEMAGAELCKILLDLYDLVNLKSNQTANKKRNVIANALMSILSVSNEAKIYALRKGLLGKLIEQIKEIYVKLSLESVECLRRVADKKRVCPVLKDLELLVGILVNFMKEDLRVKNGAAALGLADVCHKLWIWFLTQRSLLICGLKMLCTFTFESNLACQSLTLTSSVAGSGPRKVPSNVCLLQAVCTLIGKEMEQVSRTHDLTVIQLCFQLLHNSLEVIDCRMILVKNNILQSVSRLHPAITKRQKPWDSVELLWLELLEAFTIHPEGQAAVTKLNEVLDLIISFTTSGKSENKLIALNIIKNISFYMPNRPRLLTSDEFLEMLNNKLSSGSLEEKNLIVVIIWALAANNQKAKLVFKCAQLDIKLQEVLKLLRLSDVDINSEDLQRMEYVLNMLRDSDRTFEKNK